MARGSLPEQIRTSQCKAEDQRTSVHKRREPSRTNTQTHVHRRGEVERGNVGDRDGKKNKTRQRSESWQMRVPAQPSRLKIWQTCVTFYLKPFFHRWETSWLVRRLRGWKTVENASERRSGSSVSPNSFPSFSPSFKNAQRSNENIMNNHGMQNFVITAACQNHRETPRVMKDAELFCSSAVACVHLFSCNSFLCVWLLTELLRTIVRASMQEDEAG